MEDKVEQFIRSGKKDLDVFDPPANLWDRIERELDRKENKTVKASSVRVVRLSTLLKIAASVIIVSGACLFLWNYQYKQATDLANINPELARQQVHYTSMIEAKRQELKGIEREEPHLYQEFTSELRKMDESYQKLKSELHVSPNQEETIRAMIRNLQVQAEVLNQQLNVIQQINQSKKQQTDETQVI